MRICVDLDGVIAALKSENESYSENKLMPGAAEKLKELRDNGHYIIINTARRMRTHHGNPGKVIADIGMQTLAWLQENNIPYDEIHFGKPWADVYIDDNAYRFSSWNLINGDGGNLPLSSEAKKKRGDE